MLQFVNESLSDLNDNGEEVREKKEEFRDHWLLGQKWFKKLLL